MPSSPSRSSPPTCRTTPTRRRRYAFSYTITIQNTGEVAAQLIARHWIIEHADGDTEEVHGLGVVGHQPMLKPGKRSNTPAGRGCARQRRHKGHFDCMTEEAQPFQALVPRFDMDVAHSPVAEADPAQGRVLHLRRQSGKGSVVLVAALARRQHPTRRRTAARPGRQRLGTIHPMFASIPSQPVSPGHQARVRLAPLWWMLTALALGPAAACPAHPAACQHPCACHATQTLSSSQRPEKVDLPPTPSCRQVALAARRMAELPGYTGDLLTQWWPAWLRSCDNPRRLFASACQRARSLGQPTEQGIRDFVQAQFKPYRVESIQGETQGLLTGYFEPLLEASCTPRPGFQVAVHMPPSDLGSHCKPYFTRQELETLPAGRRR